MAITRPEAALGSRSVDRVSGPTSEGLDSPARFPSADESHSDSATGVGPQVRGEPSPAEIAGQGSSKRNGSSQSIQKTEGQMTFWRWLYRRIGQLVCFAAATFLLLISLLISSNPYGQPLVPIFGSAILFAVALTLRQQMIKRFDMN